MVQTAIHAAVWSTDPDPESVARVLGEVAATGFDWGEPRSLRKMVSTTTDTIAKNSLCQF